MSAPTYRAIPARHPQPVGRPATSTPALAPGAPAARLPVTSVKEAQERFWACYGPHLLDLFFGETIVMPETIEDWRRLAKAMTLILKARETASAALRPDEE